MSNAIIDSEVALCHHLDLLLDAACGDSERERGCVEVESLGTGS
jgi:hypothetical protein